MPIRVFLINSIKLFRIRRHSNLVATWATKPDAEVAIQV